MVHIDLRARHRMHFIVVGQEQQVRMPGVGHPRVDRVADGNPQAAVGNARQPFAALEHAGRQPGNQRAGHVGRVGQ